MKNGVRLLLFISHIIVGFLGFGIGIYSLPLLTASPAPSDNQIATLATDAKFTTEFQKARQDSDFLHWGKGQVTISDKIITLKGELAPGPDYKLYLSTHFIETEAEFNQQKNSMVQVGDIRSFQNFIVSVPPDINPADYTTVIVWCESFDQYITSAKYQ